MVRFEPSEDTVRAGAVVLVTLSAPTPEFLENSGLNQTHCAMCFCGLEGPPPPTIEETDIRLGVPWPPVTPEGRVPRGGAPEGRVPRGGAPKRRMPRGGPNSCDELVRELDEEARDVLEGRVPLGMEGGLPGGGPDSCNQLVRKLDEEATAVLEGRAPVGMDLEPILSEDSDEAPMDSGRSSTDYSLVDMDDDV